MKLKNLCHRFNIWCYTMLVSSILQFTGIWTSAWIKLDVCNYTGLYNSPCECDFAVGATEGIIFNRTNSDVASNRTIAISCLNEIVSKTDRCDACRKLGNSMFTIRILEAISFVCKIGFAFLYVLSCYVSLNEDFDSRKILTSCGVSTLTSAYFLGSVLNVIACGLVLGHANSNTSLGFSFYLCVTTGWYSIIGVVIFWIVVWRKIFHQNCKQASCKMQINCLRHMDSSEIDESRNSQEFSSNGQGYIDSTIIELNVSGDIDPPGVPPREVPDTSTGNSGTTNIAWRGAQFPLMVYENISKYFKKT